MTASQGGKNSPRIAEHRHESDKPYHARSMSWAQRLKRVFNIDITQCEACEKFNVKIIACITVSVVIGKILSHLDKLSNKPRDNRLSILPPLHAPPIEQDINIQRNFDWGA